MEYSFSGPLILHNLRYLELFVHTDFKLSNSYELGHSDNQVKNYVKRVETRRLCGDLFTYLMFDSVWLYTCPALCIAYSLYIAHGQVHMPL